MHYESDQSITFLIAKVRNTIKKEFDKQLKPYALSYAHRVILIRLAEKDALTQKELAEDTYFEQSNLTLMLDKLEQKGLVQRTPKKDDRRSYLVSITPEGKKLVSPMLQVGDTVINKAFKGISENQKKELESLLNVIYHNLNE